MLRRAAHTHHSRFTACSVILTRSVARELRATDDLAVAVTDNAARSEQVCRTATGRASCSDRDKTHDQIDARLRFGQILGGTEDRLHQRHIDTVDIDFANRLIGLASPSDNTARRNASQDVTVLIAHCDLVRGQVLNSYLFHLLFRK